MNEREMTLTEFRKELDQIRKLIAAELRDPVHSSWQIPLKLQRVADILESPDRREDRR